MDDLSFSGSGITMPKMSYRFRVTSPQAWLQPLLKQIIAFDIGAEDLTQSFPVHRSNRVVLWLEDDVICTVMKTIREAQAQTTNSDAGMPMPITFDLVLDLLNGGHIPLETFTFQACSFEALQHSMLNYKSGEERVELTATTIPSGSGLKNTVALEPMRLSGSITPATVSPTVLKLLQCKFATMQHVIHFEKPTDDKNL